MAKKRLKEISVNQNWCKGCRICIEFCPKQVLELDEKGFSTAVRPEDCIICKLCEMRCPDLAIRVLTEEESEQ